MTRGLIAAYREIDALVDAIEALKKQKFSTLRAERMAMGGLLRRGTDPLR